MPIFSNFPMMGPGEFIQMEDDSEGSDDPSDYVVGFGGQEEQVIVNKDFVGRGGVGRLRPLIIHKVGRWVRTQLGSC